MSEQRRDHGSVRAREGKATRIDPDVAELVELARGGRSFAATVNDALRVALDVAGVQAEPGSAPVHEVAHHASAASPPATTRPNPGVPENARADAPPPRRGGRLTTRSTSRARCPHPSGRRIGDRCGVCGTVVRTTR